MTPHGCPAPRVSWSRAEPSPCLALGCAGDMAVIPMAQHVLLGVCKNPNVPNWSQEGSVLVFLPAIRAGVSWGDFVVLPLPPNSCLDLGV